MLDDAQHPPASAPDSPTPPTRRSRKSRSTRASGARRLVLIGLSAVLIVAVVVGGYSVWRLNTNIARVDVSEQVGTDRPTAVAKAQGAVNILLVGSDNRQGKGNTGYGTNAVDPGVHSDTTLIVHLSADRDSATVVSVPRDSMTLAPPECSPTAPQTEWVTRQWNHNFKIGGVGCLIRTIEGTTGLPIDHYAVVDFNGFKSMVDALGGVAICTNQPINDREAKLNLTAGRHTLDGEQALGYVRVRKSLGDGSDLGRIKRQQAFLMSVAQEATSSKLLFQPTRLYNFLSAATQSLTTDPDLGVSTMADLATSVRSIGLDNIDFVTVPTGEFPEDPNRVQWTPDADLIWAALRDDRAIDDTPEATPSAAPDALTVAPADISVEVLNGTTTPGLAGQAADALRAQGFASVATGNASTPAQPGVVVEYGAGQEEAARTVAAAFPGATVRQSSDLGTTIEVTLGSGAPTVVTIPGLPSPSPSPSAEPSIDVRTADADICS